VLVKYSFGLESLVDARTAELEVANQALRAEVEAHRRTEDALRQSEKRLMRELDTARRLHQVSTQLIQADNIQALFDLILDTVVAVMRADYASIQMLDPERGPGGELQLLGHRGFMDQATQFWQWVRPTAQTSCAMALRTRQRVIVPDIENCDFMAGSADQRTYLQVGIRAGQTTPLLSRSGSILGMFSTYWRHAHEPAERELQLLDILARQAADLIERHLAESALRESEARFRLMADQAPVLIWMSGADKLCMWFNKPWLAFVGRAMEQELGNGWTENVHPDDFDRCVEAYRASFDTRQPFSMEYRLKRHDGEYRWVLDNGIPRYGAGGAFTGYIGSCLDITERKRAETELLLQGQVASNLAEGVCLVTAKDGLFVYADERLERMFGYGPGEMLGRHVSIANAGNGRRPADLAEEIIGVLRAKRVWTGEVNNVKKDGAIFWTYASISTYEHPEYGTVWVCALTDITGRKLAESALHASEERLRAILNTAADAIVTIDHSGIVQSVNRATEQMFGYAAAELVGQNVNMLMPSPYREAHGGYIARYLQTGEKHIIGINRETVAQRKDGTVFPVDLAVSEIPELKLFTGIHRDLTERKQLERELVEVASQTQHRIGQDLHDSVGQELTALNLLAGTLPETLEADPATASKLVERLQQGLKRSQQELRAVLRGLLPVAVDSDGLMAALTELANRTHQDGQTTCTFDCPEPVTVADNFTATHLYLIAQEAVHNALKHSRPGRILISLRSNPGLVLQVHSDGIGMPARPEANGGMGLRIMRNRATVIGAHLTITSTVPTGTVVTCRLVSKKHEPVAEKRPKRRSPRQ
jgi:PAS domain S-box-containing protein